MCFVEGREQLAKILEQRGLQYEIAKSVANVNSTLSHVEQVKRWRVLPHEFTIAGELTPTLKVMRAIVNERYAQVIADVYGDDE
jgi:long-chain acyl-CoA synthetase